jgi:hypothetical protein
MTVMTENRQLKQRFEFDATNMMTDAFTVGKGEAEYYMKGDS